MTLKEIQVIHKALQEVESAILPSPTPYWALHYLLEWDEPQCKEWLGSLSNIKDQIDDVRHNLDRLINRVFLASKNVV